MSNHDEQSDRVMARLDCTDRPADPHAKATFNMVAVVDEAVAAMITLDPSPEKLRTSGFSSTADAIEAWTGSRPWKRT